MAWRHRCRVLIYPTFEMPLGRKVKLPPQLSMTERLVRAKQVPEGQGESQRKKVDRWTEKKKEALFSAAN